MSLGFSAESSPPRSPSQAPPCAARPPGGHRHILRGPFCARVTGQLAPRSPGKPRSAESGRRPPQRPSGNDHPPAATRRHRHAVSGGLLGGARRRLSLPSPLGAHLSGGLFSAGLRASLFRAPAASIPTPPRPASSPPAPSGEAQTTEPVTVRSAAGTGRGCGRRGACGLAEPCSSGQSSRCSGAPRGGRIPGRSRQGDGLGAGLQTRHGGGHVGGARARGRAAR